MDRLLAAYVDLGVAPQRSVSLRPGIVRDDLAGGHLGIRAASEEENGSGGVEGRGMVEEAQPEQQGADQTTSSLRSSQIPNEVIQSPEESGARSGSRSGVDLVEPAGRDSDAR